MMSDEEEDGGGGRRHFSFPAIVRSEKDAGKKRKKLKKGKVEEELADDFRVDVSDPRFKAIFESHLYAPDPSHPQYRWVWHGCGSGQREDTRYVYGGPQFFLVVKFAGKDWDISHE